MVSCENFLVDDEEEASSNALPSNVSSKVVSARVGSQPQPTSFGESEAL